MKDNKFPAVFGGIMAVGVLGVGYFAFHGWSALKKADAAYSTTAREVSDLEGKPLYPSTENLAEKEELVDVFEAKTDALQTKLVAAQRALTDVQQQEFPRILLATYEKTAARAAEAMVSLPEGFYFGMEVYKGGLPQPAACSLLDWELDGINFLTNILIDSGVDSLDRIARVPMPIEDPDYGKEKPQEKKTSRKASAAAKGGAAKGGADVPYEPSRVMDTYRFTIEFTGSHGAVEKALNRIANEPSFFYWLRYMRLENQKKEGPMKGQAFVPVPVPVPVEEGAAVPDAVPDAVPPPTPDVDPSVEGDPSAETDPSTAADPLAAAEADAEALAEFEAAQTAMIDVQEILGTEKVKASVVIDLVRFKPAAEEEGAADEAAQTAP